MFCVVYFSKVECDLNVNNSVGIRNTHVTAAMFVGRMELNEEVL
jgi:hypothetical protein